MPSMPPEQRFIPVSFTRKSGLYPVIVAVSGAYTGEMAPAGFDVVVVSPHSVVPQFVGLLLGQVPERTADLEVRFRAEKINGFQNLF